MTDAETDVILFLAELYLRLGRPNHAMRLLTPLRESDPDSLPLIRLMLRAHVGLDQHEAALACIDRLVEHEFSPAELAFALAMQARALAGLGRTDASRRAWADCVAQCRRSDLDVMVYAQ